MFYKRHTIKWFALMKTRLVFGDCYQQEYTDNICKNSKIENK